MESLTAFIPINRCPLPLKCQTLPPLFSPKLFFTKITQNGLKWILNITLKTVNFYIIIIIGDAHSRVWGRADGWGRVYPPEPCDDDGEPRRGCGVGVQPHHQPPVLHGHLGDIRHTQTRGPGGADHRDGRSKEN